MTTRLLVESLVTGIAGSLLAAGLIWGGRRLYERARKRRAKAVEEKSIRTLGRNVVGAHEPYFFAAHVLRHLVAGLVLLAAGLMLAGFAVFYAALLYGGVADGPRVYVLPAATLVAGAMLTFGSMAARSFAAALDVAEGALEIRFANRRLDLEEAGRRRGSTGPPATFPPATSADVSAEAPAAGAGQQAGNTPAATTDHERSRPAPDSGPYTGENADNAR